MLRCTFLGELWYSIGYMTCNVTVACFISSYKVKAVMPSDRLCLRTNSQFWGTNYDCLDGGCLLSGTYRLSPLAFSLLTLCSFVFSVSLHCAYCHLPIIFFLLLCTFCPLLRLWTSHSTTIIIYTVMADILSRSIVIWQIFDDRLLKFQMFNVRLILLD